MVVVVGIVVAAVVVVAVVARVVVVVPVTRGADVEVVRVLEPRRHDLVVFLQQPENHRSDLSVAFPCKYCMWGNGW